jgi:hypothetical protein
MDSSSFAAPFLIADEFKQMPFAQPAVLIVEPAIVE